MTERQWKQTKLQFLLSLALGHSGDTTTGVGDCGWITWGMSGKLDS